MTAPESAAPVRAKPAKKPLWRRLLKWTFRVVILLLVLGVATYAIASYWAASAIHAEIARIRAAGEPLTFADLDALTPKVDRAQDAGPYYAAAAELGSADFRSDDDNYDALYGRKGKVVTAEVLAWAQRNVDQNRLALDLLDRGSALPGCNSDIELQYGIAVALSRSTPIRRLQLAASLRSRLLAVNGHGEQAIDSIISSLGPLRVLDRQPVLIDALLQFAFLAADCDDAKATLERGHPSDAALQKLGEAMRRLHIIQPRQMFLAERVYYLEVMRNVIANGPQFDRLEPWTPLLPEREMWSFLGITGRITVARSLPAYARYCAAASGDWPAFIAGCQRIADTPASVWDKVSGASSMNAFILNALSLATYRSTIIAIQIERYRFAHNGQLPDSLAQLPGAADFPKDPFTGDPLLYVKTADGYCVFSPGRGHPEDDTRHIDRDKDPVGWSERWGIHIRTSSPSSAPGR